MDWDNPPARLTYNNVLPGFESIDVMVVMEIIHLPQDGCHAGHKNTLEYEKQDILLFFCIKQHKLKVWHVPSGSI